MNNTDMVSVKYSIKDGSEWILENAFGTVTLNGNGEIQVVNSDSYSLHKSSAKITPEKFALHQSYPNPFNPETTISYDISNVGNVDLMISDLDYFVSYPTDLLIETNEALYGPLPWIIPAGEARIVDVGHVPLDEIDDEAFLQVESNDPADPVVIANQDANGEYSSRMEEVFDQEEISAADIIFVVDNSGSMSLWQTALADNFNSFISVFK